MIRHQKSVKCCVVECPNCSFSVKNNESFYYFPKKEESAHKWLAAIGREDLKSKKSSNLSSNYAVCSDHFTTDMLCPPLYKRLKKYAVPNIMKILEVNIKTEPGTSSYSSVPSSSLGIGIDDSAQYSSVNEIDTTDVLADGCVASPKMVSSHHRFF